MKIKLKTYIELFSPFAYEIRDFQDRRTVKELRARDGSHQVLVSMCDQYLKRWHRELNLAFDRGVRLGLAAKKSAFEQEEQNGKP